MALRAGIIGLSWIGIDPAGEASAPELGTSPPYSHASAMAAIGGIQVAAACDLDPDRRTAFTETWSAVWPAAETFADVDRMLEEPLDLVCIVTPDHLHGALLLKCIEAGVPMVFCEKPFTTDLAEADEIVARLQGGGTTVGVNHTWRWRPEVAEALSVVRSDRLGPLALVTVEAGGPRAMLFRNLSHFIDLAVHVAGADPRWVTAELEDAPDYGISYSGEGGRNPDLDPGAMAVIAFDGGIRAQVTGLKASAPDVVVQMACRRGRVTIDALGARIVELPRTGDGTPSAVSQPAIQSVRPRYTTSGMQAGLADLIDAHRQGREPASSARSARTTVAVMDAMLRSHSRGGERTDVTAPPG